MGVLPSPNLLEYNIHKVGLKIDIRQGRLTKADEPAVPTMYGKIQKGRFEVHSELATVNIDTYEAQKSCGYGMMKVGDLLKDFAAQGKQKAREGTAETVSRGDQLVTIKTKPSDIVKNKVRSNAVIWSEYNWYPKTQAKFTATKPQLSIDITPNEYKSTWENLGVSPLGFEKGSVGISMEGRPGVDFKYLGPKVYGPKMTGIMAGWYA